MPSYNVKQIAYTGPSQCLDSIACEVKEIQGSAQEGDSYRAAPYQQIVIHPTDGTVFNMANTYYLSLTIPKNQNYDLQYGIRLIEHLDSGDLDSMNYQFVRYITSRKVSETENDSDRVVLFQEQENGEFVGEVRAVIAHEIESLDDFNDYHAQTMYYYNYEGEGLYYWCKVDNEGWPYRDNRPISSAIGKNDAILSHSWKVSQTDLTDTFNIIFKPRVAGMSAIYLHLIPTPNDNDIQWQSSTSGTNATYYGRHIDVTSESFSVSLYRIKDLLDVTARRLGIWGHPGLMFHIEGEEIKIGPSGYYELHDFTVNELGIVAFGPEDKFTIDVQYS